MSSAPSPDAFGSSVSVSKLKAGGESKRTLLQRKSTSRSPQLASIAAEPAFFEDVKPFVLSVDSTIEDFKAFQQEIVHPAIVLEIMAEEDDLNLVTPFDVQCNQLLNALADVEAAIEELNTWKNEFIKASVPSNVKLDIVILFASLFRSKSNLHQPLFDLIKQVRIYSRPWKEKRTALRKLEYVYRQNQRVLEVAIRKIEQVQQKLQLKQSLQRVSMWERLAMRILQTKSVETCGFNFLDTFHMTLPRSKTPQQEITKPKKEDKRPGTAWAQLRGEIIGYIATPEWMTAARKQVKQLQSKTAEHFSGFKRQLQALKLKPLPSLFPHLPYLSTKTGTVITKIKPLPLTKSYSVPDFKSLHHHQQLKQEYDTYIQEMEKIAEEGEGVKPPNPLFKSTWSNSTNCISSLGRGAKPRRPVEKPDSADEGVAAFPANDDMILQEESESDDDGKSVDDNYSDVDEKLFTVLKKTADKQKQPAILNKTPYKSTEIESKTEDAMLNQVQEKQFTMDEVIELTLLHAQQIHILQDEYEDRMKGMSTDMNRIIQEHQDKLMTYEKELDLQHTEIGNVTQELTEVMDRNERLEDTIKLLKEELEEARNYVPVGEDAQRRPKSKHTPEKKEPERRKSSIASTRSPTRSPRKLSRVLPEVEAPKFTSPPFDMTFLERLKWSTEQQLKRRMEIKAVVMKQEMEKNERKLDSLQLLAEKSEEYISKLDKGDPFYAEFMPGPGKIPQPKITQVWQQQGISVPWGGRFRTPKADEKINVLNLFEVALNLKKSEDETQE
ncbi:hypothetical protein EDD86DRAFT_205230 [Gorgonomyces haynaldii]|nr:hypothetical protein EDD86DRAFT_205230 [Gorgonomyces haynaldii]